MNFPYKNKTRSWGRAALGGLGVLVGVSGLAGCAGASALGSAFDTNWQNDQGRSIAEVQRQLAGRQAPRGTPIALGVTGSGLIGLPFEGSRWVFDGKLDSRPQVSGDLVLVPSGGRLVALQAKDGKRLWDISAEKLSLRGVGDDGEFTAVSLGAQGGGESLLLVVDRAGKVLLEAEPNAEIGVPAVLGGVVFVPWANQYVSAIDVRSKEERGRLLLRNQVSRAMNIGGEIYFGDNQLVRFDEKIGEAFGGGGTQYTLPNRELPGRPVWHLPGNRVEEAKAKGPDSIRLLARPSPGGGFDQQQVSSTYFRVAMGFSASDAKLAWAQLFDGDILGADSVSGGYAYCTAQGEVAILSAKTGAEVATFSLEEAVQACTVQGGAYEAKPGAATEELSAQLSRVIRAKDSRLAVAQGFLLTDFGGLPSEEVTQVLIDLASSPDTPAKVIQDARKLLSQRRNGVEQMLKALEREYDFLSDVLLPPPVGPLADALAALNEPRAAAALARHLNDPTDTPNDIMRAAAALEVLASPAEFEQLKVFFALYRATAMDKEIIAAVISVAKTMLRIGGAEGRALVSEAAADSLTNEEIQAALKAFEGGANQKAAFGAAAKGVLARK